MRVKNISITRIDDIFFYQDNKEIEPIGITDYVYKPFKSLIDRYHEVNSKFGLSVSYKDLEGALFESESRANEFELIIKFKDGTRKKYKIIPRTDKEVSNIDDVIGRKDIPRALFVVDESNKKIVGVIKETPRLDIEDFKKMYFEGSYRTLSKIDFESSLKKGLPPTKKKKDYAVYDGFQSIGILLQVGIERNLYLLPSIFIISASKDSVVIFRPFCVLIDDMKYNNSLETLIKYFTENSFVPLDFHAKQVGLYNNYPIFTDMEGIFCMNISDRNKQYFTSLTYIKETLRKVKGIDENKIKEIVKQNISKAGPLFDFRVPSYKKYEQFAEEYSRKLEGCKC